MTDHSASHIADHAEPVFLEFIHRYVPECGEPDVLEMGTLRSVPTFPTCHRECVPNARTYITTDMIAGQDVDVVSDAHEMARVFGAQSMDIIIACSVWEHLRLPWICAVEAFTILRPGGLLYVQTHHSFPVHGYPDDYGRWTDHGLDAMFEWAGFTRVNSGYAYRATLTPPPEINRWNTAAEVWLNVEGLYRKDA